MEISIGRLETSNITISIFPRDDSADVAVKNHELFSLFIGILSPELSDYDIEMRWEEVLANGEWLSWDDGVAILVYPTIDENDAGSFERMRITK